MSDMRQDIKDLDFQQCEKKTMLSQEVIQIRCSDYLLFSKEIVIP